MPWFELCKFFCGLDRTEWGFVGGLLGVLGNSGTCSGTCLELSITDNQLLISNYGTKCGTCLELVWFFL